MVGQAFLRMYEKVSARGELKATDSTAMEPTSIYFFAVAAVKNGTPIVAISISSVAVSGLVAKGRVSAASIRIMP